MNNNNLQEVATESKTTMRDMVTDSEENMRKGEIEMRGEITGEIIRISIGLRLRRVLWRR